VLWPGPPAAEAQHRLAQWLAAAHRRGLPHWLSFGLVEYVSNIVMFLPLGALGCVAFRRRWLLTWFVLALFSVAIEASQAWWLPQRDGSLRDVSSNSIGAALGIAVAYWCLRKAAAHRARRTTAA